MSVGQMILDQKKLYQMRGGQLSLLMIQMGFSKLLMVRHSIVEYNLAYMLFDVNSREVLLKGKAQYSCPPSTNQFCSATFNLNYYLPPLLNKLPY